MNKILPNTIDNEYRGATVAKWFLWPFMLITLFRFIAHTLFVDGGAQSIASIPLDQFSDSAASVVINIFAQWGLIQLFLALGYLLTLIKYKSLIPLMYLIIITEGIGREVLGIVKPMQIANTPPGVYVNYVFLAFGVVMFILSLKESKKGERL